MKINLKENIWNEKYRPSRIEDCILPEPIKRNFENFVIAGNCPNLMLSSVSGGTGKTSLAKALINELDLEYLFINASEQRSIDVLRNEVTQFVSTISLEGRNKAVLFDEFCLEENEEIETGLMGDSGFVRLKDFIKEVFYPIVSLNLETMEKEADYGQIISDREEEVYEVELEDGRKILVTKEHPFFAVQGLYNNSFEEKSINSGLSEEDYILTINVEETKTDNVKIKSIKKLGKRTVRNLVVYKNHNFITRNGIVTHNCNSLPTTQNALRGFIEQYSRVKFFFSCNFLDKIIQPLQSRCTVISFDWPKSDVKYLKTKFYGKVKQILEAEGVSFKKEVVVELINRYFPDFRRIINELQKYSITGTIDEGLLVYSKELDLNEVFKALKDKNFTEIRKWTEINDGMNYEMFYKNFYKELKEVVDVACLPKLILILGEYGFRHSTHLDKQINTLCLLTEIMSEIKFK